MNNTSAITDYHPNIDAASWAQMRDFVCRTVLERYAPDRSREAVKQAMSALSGYGDWVAFSGVGVLDDSSMRRGDLIDAYTAFRTAEVSAPVSERERKVLRTLAGLTNTREHRPATTRIPPGPVYNADDIDAIRRWAQFQPTRLRQRDCTAIAAFGLGCGLIAGEMLMVRGRDITLLDDGMPAVTVTGRVVPVTAAWSTELAGLIQQEPDAYVIAPNAAMRRAMAIRDIIKQSVGMNPATKLMRATWLLQHVNAGTPMNNIMEAAGLEGPDFIRRLLPYATHLEGAAAVEALRLDGEVAL